MPEGYNVRMNPKRKNPFRPQPHLRVDPKSRRQFPVAQGSDYCPRRSRCAHTRRCARCFKYIEFEEKG